MSRKMRRHDRQVTDPEQIDDILGRAEVVRVAMAVDNEPYIVTLNYGYADGALYMHSANKGRKLDMMRANPRVCFTVDVDYGLKKADEACKWGVNYRSVVGYGRASVVEDMAGKKAALAVLMGHFDEADYDFPDANVKPVSVIRIDIEEMTAKATD